MPIPSGFEALDCQKAGRESAAQLGNPSLSTRGNPSLFSVVKIDHGGHDDREEPG